MRFGIDMRPLNTASMGLGMGVYTLNLVKHLMQRLGGADELVLYSNHPLGSLGFAGPDGQRVVDHSTESRTTALWEQFWLPLQLRRDGVNLYHNTTISGLPFVKACPYVVTVHNLAFLRHPQFVTAQMFETMERFLRRALCRAQHVIAVSECTKRDVCSLLNIPGEKVTVVYGGVEESFTPMPVEKARTRVEMVYGIHGRYILHVGTIEPQKNLPTLIRAIKVLREKAGLDVRLVIAGCRGWLCEDVYKEAEAAEGGVLFLGYVHRNDLPALYSAAECLAMPSWHEGSGLTVIEAMSCGCPVICASSGALPEVVGDGGILLPPDALDLWVEAMKQVVKDEAFGSKLREYGLERAKRFSWDIAAQGTLGAYEKALTMQN